MFYNNKLFVTILIYYFEMAIRSIEKRDQVIKIEPINTFIYTNIFPQGKKTFIFLVEKAPPPFPWTCLLRLQIIMIFFTLHMFYFYPPPLVVRKRKKKVIGVFPNCRILSLIVAHSLKLIQSKPQGFNMLKAFIKSKYWLNCLILWLDDFILPRTH